MVEYILKQEALDALRLEGITKNMRSYRRIMDIKPVEYEPMICGKWIGEEVDLGGHIAMECSSCHKVRIIDDYCSACGAKMDK